MKKLKNVSVSIVIPVYNEEHLILTVLKEMYRDATGLFFKNFEFVVVDDGSTDTTGKIVKKIAKQVPGIRLITHSHNQGLGGAILTGIKNSQFEYVTFLPGDGQIYLKDIIDALIIAPHCDLVLTYRQNTRDYSFYRKTISRCHKFFMRLFFRLPYKDYNWVHVYRRNIFTNLQIRSKGVFFLSEIVIKSHHKGYKVCEVKVIYRPRIFGDSKIIKISVILKTVTDLLRTWWMIRKHSNTINSSQLTLGDKLA